MIGFDVIYCFTYGRRNDKNFPRFRCRFMAGVLFYSFFDFVGATAPGNEADGAFGLTQRATIARIRWLLRSSDFPLFPPVICRLFRPFRSTVVMDAGIVALLIAGSANIFFIRDRWPRRSRRFRFAGVGSNVDGIDVVLSLDRYGTNVRGRGKIHGNRVIRDRKDRRIDAAKIGIGGGCSTIVDGRESVFFLEIGGTITAAAVDAIVLLRIALIPGIRRRRRKRSLEPFHDLLSGRHQLFGRSRWFAHRVGAECVRVAKRYRSRSRSGSSCSRFRFRLGPRR
mmetsp:Transcript_7629/g.18796  ORF Transcript_7629/g.18796 Transcript_7629/m.18796 type:complete len:282 (+) Transcript_7629:135-980(+)